MKKDGHAAMNSEDTRDINAVANTIHKNSIICITVCIIIYIQYIC